MYTLIKQEGNARLGKFETVHGTVQTPVFMNVGTQAAIKGGVSAFDLKDLGCQIELSNTYHLHLRPGDDVVRQMGGLHKFMRWDGPILTDSGGFQVFSLAGLRKIKEEGVTFASHLDGRRIFMGPEESMRIQSNLGSDILLRGIDKDGKLFAVSEGTATITAVSAKGHGMKNVESFADEDELSSRLASVLKEGDAVSFKASHGMRLENVIKKVYEMIG